MIIKLTFTYDGAIGSATITWTRNDVLVTDGTFSGVVISGATTTTLTIENADSDWWGNYVATVTDSEQCVVATQSFPVGCNLAITVQPESQVVAVDGEATLTFEHTGTGPFTYQWTLDGTPLTDGTTGDGAVISGATTQTLSITGFQCLEAGSYACEVTDTSFPHCTATTDDAVLSMPCPTIYYYDFEAIISNAFTNATNECPPFNLGVYSQSGSSIVPGIIGNAVQYGSPFTLANPTNTVSGIYSSCIELTDRSWTLRFWRKAADLYSELANGIAIWDGSGLQGVRVSWGKGLLPGDPWRYQFEVRPNDGGPFALGAIGPYTQPEIAAWHRIILAYDAPTRTLRFKYNDVAYVDFVQAAGFQVKSGANAIDLIPPGNPAYFLDELCLVLDKAWTEAEATYDWNGGAGRTYPDLPA